MPEPAAKNRIFVTQPLGSGAEVIPDRAQANYLFAVLRLTEGARIALFNGADGEWLAEIAEAGRKGGRLVVTERLRHQAGGPDLWLLFAPLKKARTDFLVEKAVEMGVARLCPVITRHTNAERVRTDRLAALATEAAEQCGRLEVPAIAEPEPLRAVLEGWDAARSLHFCDEAAESGAAAAPAPAPAALLIGPEGGFTGEERAALLAQPFTRRISLGPRILRAETAAVAALALWQRAEGDWR